MENTSPTAAARIARRETLRQIVALIDAREPYPQGLLRDVREFCLVEATAASVPLPSETFSPPP